MELSEIKTPEDLYDYMATHITYGWIDLEGNKHIEDMKGFRREYRTPSLKQVIDNGLAICIEQVYLMHTILDKIGVKNKMFCCRIYEPDDYGNLEEEEHMHCFLLYERQDKVYHMEWANAKTRGIHEYADEKTATKAIVAYYIALRGGVPSPTTEFYEVKEGLSFRAFNQYINHLNEVGEGERVCV